MDSISGELNPEQKEMIEELRNWNYKFSRDSKAAAIYDLWFDQFFILLWDEIRDSEANLKYPTNYSTIHIMKNFPEFKFYDNRVTPEKETLQDILLQSFQKTHEELMAWQEKNGDLSWGKFNSTTVRHLSTQNALSVSGVITDGNGGDVVNATSRGNGPSQRIIVEMDPEGVKAIGHYPGGQSGNPGSVYYDNMIEAWANRRYFKLHLMTSPESHKEVTQFSQTLEPEHE